jgi:hypothetical protein
VNPRPLQLGISLVAQDPLDSLFEAEVARQAGFDFVFMIDQLTDSNGRSRSGGRLVSPPVSEAELAVDASDRLLSMVTRTVTTVGISPFGGEEAVALRAGYARDQLALMVDEVQLAFSFLQVSIDDPSDLSVLRQLVPGAPEHQLRQMATLLDGPTTAAADRIRRFRHLGISYFTFHKSAATSWTTLGELADAVR